MANGGATAAQRQKECRGFKPCVEANGGSDGSEVGRVRSPAAGEPKGGGGVDHGGSTAVGWVEAEVARGERERVRAREKK